MYRDEFSPGCFYEKYFFKRALYLEKSKGGGVRPTAPPLATPLTGAQPGFSKGGSFQKVKGHFSVVRWALVNPRSPPPGCAPELTDDMNTAYRRHEPNLPSGQNWRKSDQNWPSYSRIDFSIFAMENCYGSRKMLKSLNIKCKKGSNRPKLVRIGILTYIWIRQSGKKYENRLRNGESEFPEFGWSSGRCHAVTVPRQGKYRDIKNTSKLV